MQDVRESIPHLVRRIGAGIIVIQLWVRGEHVVVSCSLFPLAAM